jgi:hypothetical protein
MDDALSVGLFWTKVCIWLPPGTAVLQIDRHVRRIADDPLTVLARAEETLLFAELPFETTGTNASGPLQTPWVVFTDGLQKVGPDEFIVWYGAGDTNVAGARIKVTVP